MMRVVVTRVSDVQPIKLYDSGYRKGDDVTLLIALPAAITPSPRKSQQRFVSYQFTISIVQPLKIFARPSEVYRPATYTYNIAQCYPLPLLQHHDPSSIGYQHVLQNFAQSADRDTLTSGRLG